MQTNELIAELSSKAGNGHGGFVLPLWLAAALAPLLAFAVFMAMLGPRSNMVASFATLRFDMKFVETGMLACAAFAVLWALARPARPWRGRILIMLVPIAMVLAAVVIELVVVPQHLWQSRAMGQNAQNCLIAVPIIGAPVLVLLLYALSQQAPTRPSLAGAMAGFAAGGISALFYAAHCPDDSPLFVAIWYPLATSILVATGAFCGRLFLRW